MKSKDYEEFTRELIRRLSGDDRILGIVAVGSMAAQDYLPDQWSDHDFFVIVQTGHQEHFRTELGWLPHSENIIFSFRETAHGVKVLYSTGHLLEFAVFDSHELQLARINRYRVLLDRTDIEKQMRNIGMRTMAQSEANDVHWLFGQFLTNLLVGAGRYHRGEKLSGHFFVKMSALKHLLLLCHACLDSPKKALLDNLDPFRRLEFAFPEIGEKLNSILALETLDAAVEMLGFARENLSDKIPGYSEAAVAAVKSRLMNTETGQ
jgi:lincosamide nucleotidyltransferase B/F